MTEPVICPRETDVLDLVAIGQWPARADAGLRAHVAACASCTDLASVAMAVVDARDTGAARVRVPDASLVWFRAQLRAREEATRRAARPLWVAQMAALGVAAIALALWSGGLMDWFVGGVASAWTTTVDVFARETVASTSPDNGLWSASNTTHWLLLAAALGVVLIVPIALGLSRLADGRE
ncbi:MAG TPA: hypothetical protein VHB78_01100 [Vicinamibacterales bacterium]|jgi:hypothetical protein|nr:hypothetical protein [Vicinamibacterales bacterium]